jgi:hypothetical protein
MSGEEADAWREIGTGEFFDDIQRDTAKRLERSAVAPTRNI